MNRCEPIVTSHPRNPASQAFVALARKCVEVVPTAETDARPGLLVSANTDGRNRFRRRSKTS